MADPQASASALFAPAQYLVNHHHLNTMADLPALMISSLSQDPINLLKPIMCCHDFDSPPSVVTVFPEGLYTEAELMIEDRIITGVINAILRTDLIVPFAQGHDNLADRSVLYAFIFHKTDFKDDIITTPPNTQPRVFIQSRLAGQELAEITKKEAIESLNANFISAFEDDRLNFMCTKHNSVYEMEVWKRRSSDSHHTGDMFGFRELKEELVFYNAIHPTQVCPSSSYLSRTFNVASFVMHCQ